MNVFRQRGEPALVARFIRSKIPSIQALNLPNQLQDLVMEPRGLILLVGGTGTGKSTTLASMIDYRNSHHAGHILLVEDPIEFIHEHKKSTVNQREVGLDTLSYANALKNALREAPDVIVIGEIRDQDTMKHAIAYAETGHLCLATLHANNASQAVDRIINFFPETAHRQVHQDLSLNLRAIISQRLAMGPDGRRVPVVERMINTPYISDLILQGKVEKIRDAMAQDTGRLNKIFDDALFELWQEGKLEQEEALKHADSRNNLALRMRLQGGGHSDEPTEKQINFNKKADFGRYDSFKITPLKVSKQRRQDMKEVLNYSLIHAMQDKGLHLDSQHPDLDLQYAFGMQSVQGMALEPIDHGEGREPDSAMEIKSKAKLVVTLVDTRFNKPIWRMTAQRCISGPLKNQAEINREIAQLMAEYPPSAVGHEQEKEISSSSN